MLGSLLLVSQQSLLFRSGISWYQTSHRLVGGSLGRIWLRHLPSDFALFQTGLWSLKCLPVLTHLLFLDLSAHLAFSSFGIFKACDLFLWLVSIWHMGGICSGLIPSFLDPYIGAGWLFWSRESWSSRKGLRKWNADHFPLQIQSLSCSSMLCFQEPGFFMGLSLPSSLTFCFFHSASTDGP